VLGWDAGNFSLTVPLLGSGRRGFEAEGGDEIEGGLAQGHAGDGGPQIDEVALLAAGVVEALEDVLFQVDAESFAPAVAAVQRTRATALGAAATQAGRQAELIEDLGHR
jgi:hypothetical protein